MIFSAATRRLLAWCALVAMFMAVMAPGVSRVMAAASAGNPIALASTLAEICTVNDGRGGLSVNDFICAAKIDAIFQQSFS